MSFGEEDDDENWPDEDGMDDGGLDDDEGV